MTAPIETIKKSLDVSQQAPGLLERLGVRYYRYLGRQSGTAGLRNPTIDELPDDITLQTLAGNITTFAVIIAFAVGALTTFGTVWVNVTYQGVMGDTAYYALYGGVLVAMLLVELAGLYWLGVKTVYSLACLTGQHQLSESFYLPVNYAVPNILARAALEVPDPVIHYLGIDPLKHLSRSKLLLVAVLYKAKVLLSSLVVKYVLVRLAGKGGTRTVFNWVAVPITGLWDAFTLHKVARDARLRLFGLKLTEHIVTNSLSDDLLGRLSPSAQECAIRAVAAIMVLAQNYHPNLLVLLIRFADAFHITEGNEYDNWDDFLSLLNRLSASERLFILDLLSIAAAFDGRVSRLEGRHLPQAFKELTDRYMTRTSQLTQMLVSGQLHAAKALCTLELAAG
ncbi:hypothetical protein [uncultured Thiodictyon sp.]|uniref:LBF_2804 family protein n=1 Tax=uncultured Thiodictyon sp. TaxID=1846217 RepID=UPI0025EBCF9B|nr:hypothetical protein [uncultured Thiodictyon sp.]